MIFVAYAGLAAALLVLSLVAWMRVERFLLRRPNDDDEGVRAFIKRKNEDVEECPCLDGDPGRCTLPHASEAARAARERALRAPTQAHR